MAKTTTPAIEQSSLMDWPIYLSDDKSTKFWKWRTGDYGELGIFSKEQKDQLAQDFDLTSDLAEKLSVMIGNCLDVGSSMNLFEVTWQKAISNANRRVKKARKLLRNGGPVKDVLRMLEDLSCSFGSDSAVPELLQSARTTSAGLDDTLSKMLCTPGSVFLLKPDDARNRCDQRRWHVVCSCYWILIDAGRALSYSNSADNSSGDTSSGEIIELAKRVVFYVTENNHQASGQTIIKDLQILKRSLEEEECLLETEPRFGRSIH